MSDPSTIAIVAEKGGNGKSTVAQCLAVSAWLDGKAVVVFDMDNQRSVVKWAGRRDQEDPVAEYVSPAQLDEKIAEYEELGADLIIIDTPGRLDSAVHAAVKRSHLVIVPCPANAKSLETVEDTFKLILEADRVRRPMFVALTKATPNAKSRPEEARALVREIERDFSLPLVVCPSVLHRYQLYEDADDDGITPQEMAAHTSAGEPINPVVQASKDIQGLYKFSTEVLKKFSQNEREVHGYQIAS